MRSCVVIVSTTLLAHAVYGQSSSADSYTWTPINPALTVARADACAATVGDASALVSGGIGTDGSALASADLYRTDAGFASAPEMNNARAAHSCTTLQDGRILVAGGKDGGQGNAVGTAEIYDPEEQTWEVVANLNAPRWGHTATLLNDGRVLIAGGQDVFGAKETVEIFDPSEEAFTFFPGYLSSPRINFAAVLLPGGQVAMLGGSNGSGSLSSVDIFDPEQNTITAGPALLTARASLSASALSDGTILAAGGFDGKQDLDTAEVYDLEKGSKAATGKMSTARHGHLGITLAGNGNVLILGGSRGDTPLAGSEIYNFPKGDFTVVGSLATPRTRTTVTAVGNGMVLSAGGVSTDGVTPVQSCGLFVPPSITWTLGLPTAANANSLSVQGTGFGAGTVILTWISPAPVRLPDVTTSTGTFTVAEAPLPLTARGGAVWTLTATQQAAPPKAPLSAFFSRRVVQANVSLVSSCNPCDFGQPLTLTATVSGNPPDTAVKPAGGDFVFFHDGNKVLNAGATSATSPVATRSQNLLPGTHSLFATIEGGTDGFIGQSPTLTVRVNPIPTSISVSATPDPVVTGLRVAITPKLTFDTTLAGRAGATPTGTINFRIGTVATFALPVATLASIGGSLGTLAPAPGVYTVTASYGGDANYAASTAQPVTLIVTGSSPTSASVPFVGVVNSGQWSIRNQLSTGGADSSFLSLGGGGFLPITGDWSGSGHTGIGFFDTAVARWFIQLERVDFGTGSSAAFTFGTPNAALLPVTGDWDGNGTTTVGFFDPATGNWLLLNQNFAPGSGGSTAPILFQFGAAGAGLIPVTGDWDGNGTTTIGTYDPKNSTWSLRNSNSAGPADLLFSFGHQGALPVTGNWNGGRSTGVGVYDPTTGVWTLRNSASPGPADFTFTFGSGGTPVAGKQ